MSLPLGPITSCDYYIYMAKKKTRLIQNKDGPFYVDSSCINCGSCWQINPQSFLPAGNNAYVFNQPKGSKEVYQALLALIDCPVGAIGAPKTITQNCALDIFPIPITKHPAGEVFYCGWSSRLSYGASSWLITRPEGNILIDSPRSSPELAKEIKKMGGINQMILTHRDDVADHHYWAKTFKCNRWIHIDDSDAAPASETKVTGKTELQIGRQFKLIPTPGHTPGSMVSVLGDKEQIVFSGDHLWWNPKKKVLVASKEYCWWDWNEQLKSVEKLLGLEVSWLLPGHGYAKKFEPGEWQKAVEKTLHYGESKNRRKTHCH